MSVEREIVEPAEPDIRRDDLERDDVGVWLLSGASSGLRAAPILGVV